MFRKQPVNKKIFFEPWSLGDAIIAASVAKEIKNQPVLLACHKKWQNILSIILARYSNVQLMEINLEYTTRAKSYKCLLSLQPFNKEPNCEVLGIRGDFRDWFAAKRLFPKSEIRMSGWFPFFARRIKIIEYLFPESCKKVINRYEAWAKIARVPFEDVKQSFKKNKSSVNKRGSIIIHIGAQWRSRQYPFVVQLKNLLLKIGEKVIIVGHPLDQLPPDLLKEEVLYVIDTELVNILQSAKLVITNDSGSMHLSAILGCRTISISRVSNIYEWLPPGVIPICSPKMPKTYVPDKYYKTDEILDAWPPPEQVITVIEKLM